MIRRVLSCPNKLQQLAVSEQFPFFRLQVHTLSHEIVGQTLGRVEEILPGCGFLRQNDLVTFFAKENLGTLETEFFWQPDCLASSRREQFCSFSHGAPVTAMIDTMMNIFIEWNLVVIDKLQHFGLDFIATYNDMAYKEGPLVSPQVFREVFLPKMKVVADAIKLPGPFTVTAISQL